MYGSIKKI